MAKLDTKASEKGMESHAALNTTHGKDIKQRQCPGGHFDNTPGQVGVSNVDAVVPMTATESGPKGLDSMGGSEDRGMGNHKRY